MKENKNNSCLNNINFYKIIMITTIQKNNNDNNNDDNNNNNNNNNNIGCDKNKNVIIIS